MTRLRAALAAAVVCATVMLGLMHPSGGDLLGSCALGGSSVLGGGSPPFELPQAELVAIGDLHGCELAEERAMALARASGFGRNNGAVKLVQTGDLVDRGPASALRAEHPEEVSLLLGNHELIALQGDTRYAHAGELKTLGGRLGWRKLFHPKTGALGKDLLATRVGAAVRGEGACRTLFVHGGVGLEHLRADGVRGLNTDLAAALQRLADGARLTPRDAFMFGDSGPMWSRELAEGRDACAVAKAALELVDAKRIVMGHTVQERGVTSKCGGLIHLIDVGMSVAYGGPTAIWTCSQTEGAAAVYAEGARVPLETTGMQKQ